MTASFVPQPLCARRGLICLWVLTLVAVSTATAQSSSSGAPGVNPKDNITKGELIYKFDRLDGGASLQALAFKYDHAFNVSVGANVEVPLIRLSTPGADFSGLGGRALSVYKAPEQVRIIHNYFAGPKVAFPSSFTKSSIFFQTLGFGALINALPTVLNLALKNYKAFKVSDVAMLFQQIKHFDFSAWQNIGTGTAAETQAGDDLKQELLNAFTEGDDGPGQTIDLGS